jgi:hypothetical protein
MGLRIRFNQTEDEEARTLNQSMIEKRWNKRKITEENLKQLYLTQKLQTVSIKTFQLNCCVIIFPHILS